MAFDPVDYYYLADILYKQVNKPYTEASHRATISRAYYGAFLVARKKSGITKSSGSVHQDVYNHFHQNSITSKIANNLDSLRFKRNDADYEMDKTMTSRDSGIALKLAAQILKGLGVNLTQSK